jgi:hypothetical protein
LYSTRMGQAVPFQRLSDKPIKGATLQGADLLALTLEYREAPRPVVVEVKFRASSPPSVLTALSDSLKGAEEDDYLASAWVSGVRLMDRHPDVDKAFALSAAQHLARLVEPDEPSPPHARHAVILTGSTTITPAEIQKKWGASPPVSHLHIVVVDDAEKVMNDAYEHAAQLSYAETTSGVLAALESQQLRPGIAAHVSSIEAAAAARGGPSGYQALTEIALWLLADWDGMGDARARRLAPATEMADVRGLALLLSGDSTRSKQELANHPDLFEFAERTAEAWDLEITGDELMARTADIPARMEDPELAQALDTIRAAVKYRLTRHPVALTRAAGATGAHVEHAVQEMRRRNIQALWPSQAKAVGSGLLDAQCPSLAIKMPTSAGKTALMDLLVADTLDRTDDAVVAVLGTTKALVSQLTRGLRASLAKGVDVRSSYGGLDYDTEDPGAEGILNGPGVAVLTPERFDLEWRRSVTGADNSTTSRLRLLVVDEAHLLMERGRGERLELVVGRALRDGIRVVLLSSQFPDTNTISKWIEGRTIESDWTPTWLRRSVYFPGPGKKTGLLQTEVGEPSQVLVLDTKAPPGAAGTCPPNRADESIELAASLADDGLVIVYANEKARVAKLVEVAAVRFPPVDPIDPQLDALVVPIAVAEPDFARLLRSGIGVHHAGVPRAVKQVVEAAARKDLLRCIICTPTLLEGVDFPARTVIAAYPPWTKGVPQVARLRNLAGRAGRGGRLTYGSLVVMCSEEKHAKTWLQAFRAKLPMTTSALTGALEWLIRNANDEKLLVVGADEPDQVASLDALILAGTAEGGVIDGDLRARLEEVLGRTLWATGMQANRREFLLDRAEERAGRVRKAIGPDAWTRAFYRVGLPLKTCLMLRDAVKPHGVDVAAKVDAFDSDLDGLLVGLATIVAPAAPQLEGWADLPEADLRKVLQLWLEGEPVEGIDSAFPEVWDVIEGHLDSLLPWVLTAIIEFVATDLGRPELRDLAHVRMTPARLRYGVPSTDLCDYVKAGFDRSTVTGYQRDYNKLVAAGQISATFDEYATERAATDAERLLEEALAAEAARQAETAAAQP